jgi:DNA (cytosine-5)-methyltransferase 1
MFKETSAVLTFGSVCSGIEAASVAWEPLGWRPAWFAEIDPFASAVLAHRWPGVENRGDFTRIESESPGSIDVLVGGTPCQSFSVAGRRLGLDDPRGNLAIEFLRLARRLRPLWLVWENVPGVLSSGGGRDFGAFLGLLGQLGYGFAYRVLDAQHFGVPQRRRRVFVVGHLGDWRRAAAVLFERESLSGNPPPGREAAKDVAGSLGGGTGERGWCDDFDRAGAFVTAYSTSGPSYWRQGLGTLKARDYKDGHDTGLIAHSLRADGFDASEDGTGRGTPLIPIDLRQASRGGKITNHRSHGSGGPPSVGVGNVGDPAFTVSERGQAIGFIVNAAESCAKQSHAREAEVARCIDSNGSFATAQGGTVVAYNVQAQYSEGTGPHARPDSVSKCLDSHGLNPDCQQGGTVVAYRTAGNCGPFEQGDVTACLNTATDPSQNILLGRSAVRRLTPREAERLQGFPDDWTLLPAAAQPKGVRKRVKGRDRAETLAYLIAAGCSPDQAETLVDSPDGPRYRAVGNSMAVPVMRWIGQRIQMVNDLVINVA